MLKHRASNRGSYGIEEERSNVSVAKRAPKKPSRLKNFKRFNGKVSKAAGRTLKGDDAAGG